MTLQQIEYALALDQYRSFTKAAKSCYVTQPTLTMQIKKLEQELDTEIFDRSQSPIELTREGEIFIERSRNIMSEVRDLNLALKTSSDLMVGEFRLGIIPTLAPYLLPIFLPTFQHEYPNTRLIISEVQTKNLIAQLREDHIDFGIAATPLNEKDLIEVKLYEEPFLLYTNQKEEYASNELHIEDIDASRMLIMEQGHCFRNQTLNLCDIPDVELGSNFSFKYAAGSIEGLKNLVDQGIGETLIPHLSVNEVDKDKVIQFAEPVPAREISLITHRRNNLRMLTNTLRDCIIDQIPADLVKGKMSRKIMPIV